MKNIRYYINRLGIIQVSLVLLLIGLVLGVLIANLFKNSYLEQIQDLETNVFTSIAVNKINYSGLFIFTLKKNLKELARFALLSITILGIPYIIYKVLAFGFYASFFISVVTINYGFKGIILILAYVFPHGLIYLPVVLLSLYKGFNLCKTIYYDRNNHFDNIFSLLKGYIGVFLLLVFAIAIASFIEAYIGAFFLKKALSLFT